MKIYPSLLSLLVVGACTAMTPLQAQNRPSLASQMGEAQFHAAGLDSLSPTQLAVLEGWLAHHTRPLPVAVAPSQAKSARLAAAGGMVEGQQGGLISADLASGTSTPKPSSAIDSRIAGSFNGWGPGSVIVLANGQRWRVIDDSSLQIGKPLSSPPVHIAKSLFGTWTLRVKGFNTRARLEPVN